MMVFNTQWIGFFICPVCNKTNYIKNWIVEKGDNINICLTADYCANLQNKHNKLVLKCSCGSEIIVGLTKLSKKCFNQNLGGN